MAVFRGIEGSSPPRPSRTRSTLSVTGRRRAAVGRIVLAALLVLSVTGTSFSQRPVRGKRPVPFTRYVPASTKLFITVPRLGELNAAFHGAHAWHLLPLIAGSPPRTEGSFNLREAVNKFLGPQSSVTADDLLKAEIGVVATSWSELGSAVWLVRIEDEKVLDRWFPRNNRVFDRRTKLGVRFIWTKDGVSLCVRDDVVALARRTAGGSMVSAVRSMMNGRPGDTLERSATFQASREHLPARPLAVVHLSKLDESTVPNDGSSLLLPAFSQTVVGLYERSGRIELAISGSVAAPLGKTALSAKAITRVAQLPQTTLFTWATTIDFGQAYASAQGPPSATLGRYLTLLAGLGSGHMTASELFGKLGPNVILVWGQDLSDDGGTPQLAVLIECKAPREVRSEARHIAGRLLRMVAEADTVTDGATPSIDLDLHLGTPILHVPLTEYAAESRFPFAPLLGEVEPAWATAGDWFILALSRDHLERILDAHNGLIPTLDTVRDVAQLVRRRQDRSALAVIQAGLASDVLAGWLKSFEAGHPSLLDPTWWGPRRAVHVDTLEQLGISPLAEQEPGVVLVEMVEDAGPVGGGRLRAKDRIIGVDGYLLDLRNPAADLRRRLAASTTHLAPTLRVLRGEMIMDVPLAGNIGRAQLPELVVKPRDTVRELALVGRTLQVVTLETYSSDELRYLARLSLRVSEDQTP